MSVKPNINLKSILGLFADVFDITQAKMAKHLHIQDSQMSNAASGHRYIHKNELWKVFLDASVSVPADTENPEKPYTKQAILNHLKERELLFPDIEKAAEKEYIDVVTAILDHYPTKQESRAPESFEDAIKSGKEYFKCGDYAEALRNYGEAEKLLSDDPCEERRLLKNMANAFLKQGDYANALSHYGRARDISVHLGDDDGETAELYECIGVVLRKAMRYSEADENFKKAEDILEKRVSFDENAPEAAKLYNDFGLNSLNEKDFKRAKYYYDKSYKMRENNYNKNNSVESALEFAYSVHNMGTYYNKIVTDRTEDFTEDEKIEVLNKAAEYHEKAYRMRTKLLNGEDALEVVKKKNAPLAHICMEIAQSLTLWASDLCELGELDAALNKCEQGLKIREKKHGGDIESQDIAWSHYTLGLIYDKLKKPEESLEHFSKSYHIRFKVCNGEHPYAAKALFQMGRLKHVLSRSQDALLNVKQAYEIQKRTLKENDPELLDTIELMEKIKN